MNLLIHWSPKNIKKRAKGGDNPDIFTFESGKGISYNTKIGMFLSFFVGYIASLVGIGGGIIHVPVLVDMLDFPVHIATATSHFVLAVMAFVSTAVHLATGTLTLASLKKIMFIGIGVIAGAQIGAKASSRIKGIWILRCLAVALGLSGLRILFMHSR